MKRNKDKLKGITLNDNTMAVLVDPRGVCHLVNTVTRKCLFSHKTRNPEVKNEYQSNHMKKPYMDIKCVGSSKTLHYISAENKKKVLEITPDVVRKFVEGRLGELSHTPEVINVERSTVEGKIKFSMTKGTYKVQGYTNWNLDFTDYNNGEYYLENIHSQVFRASCPIYHFTDMTKFIEYSESINVTSFEWETLNDLGFYDWVTSEGRGIRRLETQRSCTSREIYDGFYFHRQVDVEVIRDPLDISVIVNSLIDINDKCPNRVTYIEAGYEFGVGYLLAFQKYEKNLMQHLVTKKTFWKEKEYWRPDTKQANAIRDLVAGMRSIHANGFCHGNLLPENIMIDENGMMVINGLSDCKPHTPLGAAWDVFCLGIVIYYLATGELIPVTGKNMDDNSNDYRGNIVCISDKLHEVKHMLTELLHPDPHSRIRDMKVINDDFAWLWSNDKRMKFLRVLNDDVITWVRHDIYKKIDECCNFNNGTWKDFFGNEFVSIFNQFNNHYIQEQMKNDTTLKKANAKGYNTKSVVHFTKYIRNFVNHRNSVDPKLLTKFAATDHDMINRVMKIFPSFFSDLNGVVSMYTENGELNMDVLETFYV